MTGGLKNEMEGFVMATQDHCNED